MLLKSHLNQIYINLFIVLWLYVRLLSNRLVFTTTQFLYRYITYLQHIGTYQIGMYRFI